MLTTEIRTKKTITNHMKRKSDSSNNKKNTTTENDSITEIQASDLDTCTEIEDSDSMGWRSLSEIPPTSVDSDPYPL